MKVSIMQPNIFMWGGLLKSLIESDLHVIRDDVKSTKNARYNRNLIAGKGEAVWFTIPFVGFKDKNLINQQNLNTSKKTVRKLKNLFLSKYDKFKYYENALDLISYTLDFDRDETSLCDVYVKFLEGLKSLGYPVCRFIFASSLKINENLDSKLFGLEMVNEILKVTEADTYLASENTVNYANPNEYKTKKVMIQKYQDAFYKGYEKNDCKSNQNLSCLDMISSLSLENSIDHLDCSNKWKIYYPG
tara:strand:- start:233 stop:970 length:738 start_codon:yes stop_codon:yes gene_type:complete